MLFSFNFYSNPVVCAELRLKINCEFAENLLEIYVDTNHVGAFGYLFHSLWIMDGIWTAADFVDPPAYHEVEGGSF